MAQESDIPTEFIPTKRAIFSKEDLEEFLESQAYKHIIAFVKLCGQACREKKNSCECLMSPIIYKILDLLEILNKWIDEIPPLTQPQRYGNKAYRIWATRLVDKSEGLCRNILPPEFEKASIELSSYLNDSFGNQTRIDYGTGHECTFILFLCGLYKLQIIKKDDLTAVVTKVFTRYISLCRRIQLTYMLEAAGTHGVWSLDDYQMLVFFFGASQLVNNEDIEPGSIFKDEILNKYSNDYLYVDAIAFIKKVKIGEFYEHSPILNEISHLPKWDKIMIRMYSIFETEVLHKFPVIQHFRFGNLFKCEWTPSANPDDREYVKLKPPPMEEQKNNIINEEK